MNLIWMDPVAGAAADPAARLAAVHRRGRRPLVPSPPGRSDRVRRADARLGQPPLAGLGSGRVHRSDRRRLAPGRSGPRTSSRSSRFEPLPAGKHGIGFDPFRSSREDYRLPALPEGDRPRARQAHGGPRLAAHGDRRLERRARRDRQPGPGRERLARLLPLLHPGSDGRHRGTEGGSRPAGILPRAAARLSRAPWSGPGETTATCAPSTTTAPRSASREAASGRSTP